MLESIYNGLFYTIGGQFTLIYGLLGLIFYWSFKRNPDPLGEKEYYDHMDRFRNGEFDQEMKNTSNEKY